jgi:CRISPR-associated exonuclease Cas4
MTIALALMLLAGILLWSALRLRKKTGIPWVRIVGSDTNQGLPVQQPLFARRYALTGKPDYMLENSQGYIPVEVKPGRHVRKPYESDLMQLLAYCLLVEETTGQPPAYGLLRYATESFQVPYTPAMRAHLLTILNEMREAMLMEDCTRNHDNPQRCRVCGFLAICEEALVQT